MKYENLINLDLLKAFGTKFKTKADETYQPKGTYLTEHQSLDAYKVKNATTKTEGKVTLALTDGVLSISESDIASATDLTALTATVGTKANQTDLDALTSRVSTTETTLTSKANSDYVYTKTEVTESLALKANVSDLTKLAEKVTTNTNAITTLNGSSTTEGSVAKTVADAIAKVVDGAPEAFDTLKEIAEWITGTDKINTDAADMLSDITALKSTVGSAASGTAGEDGYIAATGLVKEIEDIKADIATMATDDTVAQLQTRVTTAEGNITTNTSAIENLNGDASTAGSVANTVANALTSYKVKDATNKTDGHVQFNLSDAGVLSVAESDIASATELTALTTRVSTAEGNISTNAYNIATNTTAITTLNGGDTVEGSVAKTVKDAVAALNISNYYTKDEADKKFAEVTLATQTDVESYVEGLF